jgi:hypothetical protein
MELAQFREDDNDEFDLNSLLILSLPDMTISDPLVPTSSTPPYL